LDALCVPVEGDDLMARAHEAPGNIRSHPAKANHCETQFLCTPNERWALDGSIKPRVKLGGCRAAVYLAGR
jgi:hypothetical protein